MHCFAAPDSDATSHCQLGLIVQANASSPTNGAVTIGLRGEL
jgi:hypothetical protein